MGPIFLDLRPLWLPETDASIALQSPTEPLSCEAKLNEKDSEDIANMGLAEILWVELSQGLVATSLVAMNPR